MGSLTSRLLSQTKHTPDRHQHADDGLHPVCLAVYEESPPPPPSPSSSLGDTEATGTKKPAAAGGTPSARLLHATNAACDRLFQGALRMADDVAERRTMHDLLSVA